MEEFPGGPNGRPRNRSLIRNTSAGKLENATQPPKYRTFYEHRQQELLIPVCTYGTANPGENTRVE